MGMGLLETYYLGDMAAEYWIGQEGQVGLMLLPAQMPATEQGRLEKKKHENVDSLVQIKLSGDIYDEAYAMGNSMRNSESVRRMEYKGQEVRQELGKTVIKTVLEAPGLYQVSHYLAWKEGAPYVRISCKVENIGKESISLEMFESFSLSGISPYLEGDGHCGMQVHRLRSVWSQEGRLETIPLEDLQLEPAWDPHAVRCEKFGQAGSMPVNKFFPFVAVEDTKHHVFWGAQIAHNASWQIELYRKDDGLAVSGGLADRDFGHWMKNIGPGQEFTTPEAIVSAAQTESLDIFTGRLAAAALEGMENVPELERELPIVFNEYCTTWGEPSHRNISKILEAIKGKGFQYFVIDCGWYKEKDVPWDIGMGDYEVSQELFPEGLGKTAEAIKQAGMVPGIWFEIETVGKAARAYQLEEHLLHKDGKVLTSYFRRFWDMRDPWAEAYLTKKVIGTLQRYGFGYMKIDYNETIGIGCDGAESLGEGLRQNMEASAAFFEKVKREVPGIVLENCSSGGHRLAPGLMAQMSMASFSDAHECEEIPIIAANLHRAIHPAQSQIWAVIRQGDSLQRIAYSMVNTFLGRMCISGDVTGLSKRQWEMIDSGIAFYKNIVPIIRSGQSYRFGPKVKSARHPEGWQALLRVGGSGEAYLAIHVFSHNALPEEIKIPLPSGCPEHVLDIYSEQPEQVEVQGHCLYYTAEKSQKALAVRLGAFV